MKLINMKFSPSSWYSILLRSIVLTTLLQNTIDLHFIKEQVKSKFYTHFNLHVYSEDIR
jgi:hypothetical protein